MIIKNEELINVYGGVSSISSLINAITKLVNAVLDIGRAIGSAIRYKKGKISC